MRSQYRGYSIFLSCLVLFSVVGSVVSNSDQPQMSSEITSTPEFDVTTSNPVLSSPAHIHTNTTDQEAFFDDLMTEHLETLNIPGATLAVVQNDTLLFSKGYGVANLANQHLVQANQTLFRVGSISKLFTWTAIMQLWEQGKVDLDTDVNSYLPFEIPSTYPEPITLNHLMTHTAGFESRWFGMAAEGPEDLKSLADYCVTVLPARVRPPGEVQAYSNYGAALAGYIVERISGLSFTEYITEYIYTPLGMTHSTFLQPIPSNQAEHITVGYESSSDGLEEVEFWYGNASPAGTMSTTATDMAKFMIAHLQDGQYGTSRIIEPLTAQKMHSRSFSHDPRMNGWAHGWEEKTINGQRFIQHGGSLPGFVARLTLSLEHQFGIFLAYNHPNGFIAQIELVQAFMDAYYPAPAPSPVIPLPNYTARAHRFTGTYRHTRSTYATIGMLYDFPRFIIQNDEEGRLWVGGAPVPFIEVEPLLFYPIEDGTIIAGDNYIIFRENSQGQITHLFINNRSTGAYERLTWTDNETLHLIVLFFSLFVFSAALLFPILAFVIQKWRTPHPQPISKLPRSTSLGIRELLVWSPVLTQGLTIVTSGIFLLFVVLFLGLSIPPDSFLHGRIPFYIYIVFSLPLIATLLTGLLLGFVGLVWMSQSWNLRQRIFSTVVVSTCLLFLTLLRYWNLLGFHF